MKISFDNIALYLAELDNQSVTIHRLNTYIEGRHAYIR